jgi:hypothetical protein
MPDLASYTSHKILELSRLVKSAIIIIAHDWPVHWSAGLAHAQGRSAIKAKYAYPFTHLQKGTKSTDTGHFEATAGLKGFQSVTCDVCTPGPMIQA